MKLDLFGHQQKILVIFASVFHFYLAEKGLLRTFPFYCCIFSPHFAFFDQPIRFRWTCFDLSRRLCEHYVTLVESPRFRVCFLLLGLCMWKSPCCTYYSALIRCEIKGDFEELKKPIHYVLWSGNAKHQSSTINTCIQRRL